VSPTWKERPGGGYDASLQFDEVGDRVQGWATKRTDSAGEEFGSDQEELVHAYVPFEGYTLRIKVSFRRE